MSHGTFCATNAVQVIKRHGKMFRSTGIKTSNIVPVFCASKFQLQHVVWYDAEGVRSTKPACILKASEKKQTFYFNQV